MLPLNCLVHERGVHTVAFGRCVERIVGVIEQIVTVLVEHCVGWLVMLTSCGVACNLTWMLSSRWAVRQEEALRMLCDGLKAFLGMGLLLVRALERPVARLPPDRHHHGQGLRPHEPALRRALRGHPP